MAFCIIHYNKCYSYLPHDEIAHWKVKIRIEHQVPLTCSTDVDLHCNIDVCENSYRPTLDGVGKNRFFLFCQLTFC